MPRVAVATPWNNRWCAAHSRAITTKLSRKLKIWLRFSVITSTELCPALIASPTASTSGSTSSVIAMATTASVKNTSRSAVWGSVTGPT
jgi:hypothetical protein